MAGCCPCNSSWPLDCDQAVQCRHQGAADQLTRLQCRRGTVIGQLSLAITPLHPPQQRADAVPGQRALSPAEPHLDRNPDGFMVQLPVSTPRNAPDEPDMETHEERGEPPSELLQRLRANLQVVALVS